MVVPSLLFEKAILLRLQVDWEKFLPEEDEGSHGTPELIFLNAFFIPKGF